MTARPDLQNRFMLALGWLVTGSLLLIPLAVTPGLIDRYRVIKESLARAEGILGAFVVVAALACAGSHRLREMLRERAVVAVVAAGVFWAILTTVVSTHRTHSLDALATVLGSLLVFAIAWYAAPRISLSALALLIVPVLLNTLLVALQRHGIYQPFESSPLMPRHLRATGLIGNPNIVGSYMTLVTIVFAAAALHTAGMRRWVYALGTVCALAGVMVSETRTAVIALGAGLLLLAIGRSVRRALAVAAAVVAALLLAIMLEVRVVMEVVTLPQVVASRGLDAASSGRITPFLSGVEMARDRPLLGLGPGTYGYHYMAYKIRTSEKYRLTSVVNMNFGEAHNDHVQLLAETGAPGYLLFLAAVLVLVVTVRRPPEETERSNVARGIVVPLAGTLLVLCLAQFPLFVPITRHFVVTMAGLLAGWSRT